MYANTTSDRTTTTINNVQRFQGCFIHSPRDAWKTNAHHTIIILSTRLSIRLTHSWTTSKVHNKQSNFSDRLLAHHSITRIINDFAKFRWGRPQRQR